MNASKNWNSGVHIFWARLASYPLIVLTFHDETHDPKGQENKIYTIVKDRETFYRRHTVPVTSCSEVKYVLKRVSFGSKECIKDLKLECAYFLDQTHGIKSHTTITSHQEDKLSKTASSLFPIKMIAN